MANQSNLFDVISTEKEKLPQLDIIVIILQIYNCRASEILDATWDNFHPGKFLVLQGKKRSGNVIIRDRIILRQISMIEKIKPPQIFYAVTYPKLYRHIKKYYSHMFVRYKGKKNYKVTHGFRYANVDGIDNDEFIRDILNHRSKKSGIYYKSKKG